MADLVLTVTILDAYVEELKPYLLLAIPNDTSMSDKQWVEFNIKQYLLHLIRQGKEIQARASAESNDEDKIT